MAGKLGFGAVLAYESAPGVYTTIAQVTKVRPYALKADVVDVSDHASTDKWREKVAGLLDAGSAQFDLNYDQDATTHQLLETTVGATETFKVTFPGAGRKATFTGFVESVTPEVPHDNKMTCSVTIQISGKVTWAA